MGQQINYAPFYAQLWPRLRDRARELGYALGLHGSVVRDMDIMAMPWTDEAVSAEELVAALLEVCGGSIPHLGGDERTCWASSTEPERKPHGRVAWSISFGGHPFVDLSVMPRMVR